MSALDEIKERVLSDLKDIQVDLERTRKRVSALDLVHIEEAAVNLFLYVRRRRLELET